MNASATRLILVGARRRNRGLTIITALVFSLIAALFVGAAVALGGASYNQSVERDWVEKSQLLAEAGLNYEMNYIGTRSQTNQSPYYHSNTTQAGEPYPGQPGTIPEVPEGKFWVYSTPGANGAITVTCTAAVGGSAATVGGVTTWSGGAVKTISASGSYWSIFGLYAVCALDEQGSANGSNPALDYTGANVKIVGTVCTNWTTSGQNSNVSYTSGINANTGSSNYGVSMPSGQGQLPKQTGATLVDQSYPEIFGTVPEVMRTLFNLTASTDPFTWLSTNNNNDQIRVFKSVGAALNNGGTQTAGFTQSETTFFDTNPPGSFKNILAPQGNQTNGAWTGVTGTDPTIGAYAGKVALIFPPGDYYFTDVQISYISNYEIIIDNAGLTTAAGSNASKKQVRWFIGNGKTPTTDYISLPMHMTDSSDPSTFRVMYAKDGCTFEFRRDSNMPSGAFNLVGAVYAVTNHITSTTNYTLVNGTKMTGTIIKFTGSTSTSTDLTKLDGALNADRVIFNGYCEIDFDKNVTNVNDPIAGSGFTGGYSDGG